MPKHKNLTSPTGLDERQERFCLEYVKDGNATRAAITAGYSKKSARSQASDLLTRPNISQRIQALRQKTAAKIEITVDKIAQEYAKIAFRDARQLFDENGKLIPIHKLSAEAAAAIDGIKVKRKKIGRQRNEDDEEGGEGGEGDDIEEEVEILEYKLTNKIGALADLGKHLGFFGKDVPQQPPSPTYVQTQMILNVLSIDQLREIERKMLEAQNTIDSTATEQKT